MKKLLDKKRPPGKEAEPGSQYLYPSRPLGYRRIISNFSRNVKI
jgi:hypothetical protein